MAGHGASIKSGVEGLENVASLVGMSVEDIRNEFSDVLGIPEGANPTVNGASVDEDYRLVADDVLRFSRPTGEKG